MAKQERAPAFAVIGAGYGDEGKGVVTDALAHALGSETIVIRHNGGAQAGHTVTTPDGRRHVFHHVGSGSFVGAATFLSRHFVSNPIVLADEITTLSRLGVGPRIAADERGLLTTPWDMMINQFIEDARGDGRHGSCGLGFGETIERCLNPDFATDLAMLRGDLGRLHDRFERIRREWVPARLTRLGYPGLYLRHRELILSEDGMERAVASAIAMLGHVDLVGRPGDAIAPDAPLVFEGAQGLMLDQGRGAFPHVTRSNTGLANVLDVAGELGLGRLQAVYATRAYVTRHGAGPLAHEQSATPSPLFADATNQPNPWQGRLRFGRLDLDVFGQAIRADLSDAVGGPVEVVPRLAITCLDQFDGKPIGWIEEGSAVEGSDAHLAARAQEIAGASTTPILSYGPGRTTLRNLPSAVKA